MQRPIGIFDSGVGGTSIWKEIVTLLPNESTIYLADSKHAPYGNKTPEEILRLCIKNTEFLIAQGAKIIVVACNTATTNAISYLRNKYPIPFIGIEPAIKPAASLSMNKSVGILATKGTLNSALFSATSKRYSADINLLEVVGEGLVPLIEAGALESLRLKNLLKEYLQPMITANIDYLVLGCSHYPYLIPLLKELLPPTVIIIDSGEAAARQTLAVLSQNNLLNEKNQMATHHIYSNLQTETLQKLLTNFHPSPKFELKTF